MGTLTELGWTLGRMAKLGGIYLVVLAMFLSSTDAYQYQTELDEISSDPRLFFTNYTSSLLAINTTILLYAVGAAATIGAIVLAVYLLAQAPAPAGYSSYSQGYQARGSRQNSGYDILHLLAVASDIYQKLETDDVDCQKKIMCEFFDEPEMFGNGAVKVKSGFQTAASWLKPFGFTIVDQITKATTMNEQNSENCEETYKECDRLSLRDTVEEKAKVVKEVKSDLNKEIKEEEKEEDKSEEDYEYYYEDTESRRK